jgi:hypothetical protein
MPLVGLPLAGLAMKKAAQGWERALDKMGERASLTKVASTLR